MGGDDRGRAPRDGDPRRRLQWRDVHLPRGRQSHVRHRDRRRRHLLRVRRHEQPLVQWPRADHRHLPDGQRRNLRRALALADGFPVSDVGADPRPERGTIVRSDVNPDLRADGDANLRADSAPNAQPLPTPDVEPDTGAVGGANVYSHLRPLVNPDLRADARADVEPDLRALVRADLRSHFRTLVDADAGLHRGRRVPVQARAVRFGGRRLGWRGLQHHHGRSNSACRHTRGRRPSGAPALSRGRRAQDRGRRVGLRHRDQLDVFGHARRQLQRGS